MKHTLITAPALALALLAGVGGCMLEYDGAESDALDPADLGEVHLALSNCVGVLCGTNTGKIYDKIMGWLSETPGVAEVDGFSLRYLEKKSGGLSQTYNLRVAEGRLQGFQDGVLMLDNEQLEGAFFTLERNGDFYNVFIDDVMDITTPDGVKVPAYKLRYKLDAPALPDGRPVTEELLCPNWKYAEVDELVGPGEGAYSIIIHGERYPNDGLDAADIMTGTNADGWFHFACASTALFKMVMVGHDPKVTDPLAPGYSTTAQRLATLRMFIADYCGTGRTFTVTGEPLIWGGPADPEKFFFGLNPKLRETIWTPDGAHCLDVARYADKDPWIYFGIFAECGALPPACSADPGAGVFAAWPADAVWATYSPSP
ncbi:ADYC domain-containing protein [Haliangium sp.]|uniref:ADYC domain-containing protein n=1 Tax=Haliangium sp. TaxID=2663208 RepID=UPI003D126C18